MLASNSAFATPVLDDSAENSIMQTISIAVSAILIAAGLITAPSLINNARDVNAQGDLANLAQAQEFYLADSSTYADTASILNEGEGTLRSSTDVKYTLSVPQDKDRLHSVTCEVDDVQHYVMQVTSESERDFWRTDGSTAILKSADDARAAAPECLSTSQLAEVKLAEASAPSVAFYDEPTTITASTEEGSEYIELSFLHPGAGLRVFDPAHNPQLYQESNSSDFFGGTVVVDYSAFQNDSAFAGGLSGSITYQGRVIGTYTGLEAGQQFILDSDPSKVASGFRMIGVNIPHPPDWNNVVSGEATITVLGDTITLPVAPAIL